MAKHSLTHWLKAVNSNEPDVQTAGAKNGDIIDTRGFKQALVVLMIGTLGTNATVDCKVQHGEASNLSDAADVSGAAFTQVTQAGTDQSDKVYQISVGLEGLGRYIRTVMTVAVATSDAATLIVLGDATARPITAQESADGGHTP